MDLEEKLLESHKSLSKINATVLALVLVMSVYIFQRALDVIAGSPELLSRLSGLTSKNYQINFFQLAFTYKTMTVLWPGVLGGLCILYSILEDKRNRIEHSVRRLRGAMRDVDMVEVDPLHVSPSLFRYWATRRVASVFALFPIIAVAIHLTMILMWAVTLGWGATRQYVEHYTIEGISVAAGSMFSLSSLLFSVVGFFGALLFWKISRGRISVSGTGDDKNKVTRS